ncbi:hypothetical protein A4H97_29860 [Niastella yeongjuensis]|uniref:Glycosyltransferase RgtA/B/C/D-like domain-containing protein n=1 Tax=Niastella yeongjuensis TaxID=354355 RepID=A0A1V9EQ29_9BACT|nr:hypothetical protein [Niastella yeongjuensis]OQP48044.1 hypothetical protein A4H97_29860 [Niastella yeongjuensis]SEO24611.1 hypothetical protein SAMN05660816_02372 [Niastella yeongjuensis]
MLFDQPISTIPFKQWLRENKENRRLFLFFVIAMTISFTWIKILYPFPNFMPPDSISYIQAAQNNDFINMWPIGYSKFIRFLGAVNKSDLFLVAVQFILIQIAMLYLLFTIRYLLLPGKWMFRILFIACFSNPLLLHVANFISSDSLFIAVSILWFTQLLWILYRPTMKLMLTHSIILLVTFTVRYNAIYYPFISLAFFGLAQIPKTHKLIGIGFTISLLFSFVGLTQYEYYKKTSTVQFSAFAGWQLASNALYGYAYSPEYPVSKVPVLFRGLHESVNQHMNMLNKRVLRPDGDVGIYYLWDPQSPLWTYLNEIRRDDTGSLFLKWSKMAPLYSAYGRYLIAQNPTGYVKHFLLPNLRKFYVPPPSFMVIYNMGNDTVDSKAALWFGWKNNKVFTRSKTAIIQIVELSIIPIAIINVLFLLSCAAFTLAGGFKRSGGYARRAVILMLAIWFVNMAFSILAAPNELRYQLFPLVITICFTCLLIAWLFEHAFSKQNITNIPQDSNPLSNSLSH